MDQNQSTTCIKSLSILEAVASILKELALANSSNTFPHKSEKIEKKPLLMPKAPSPSPKKIARQKQHKKYHREAKGF